MSGRIFLKMSGNLSTFCSKCCFLEICLIFRVIKKNLPNFTIKGGEEGGNVEKYIIFLCNVMTHKSPISDLGLSSPRILHNMLNFAVSHQAQDTKRGVMFYLQISYTINSSKIHFYKFNNRLQYY